MTTFIDSLLTCIKLWCVWLTCLYVGIVPNITLNEVTSVTMPPTPTTIGLEILLPSVGAGVASVLILAVALLLLFVFIKQRVAAKYSL